MARFLRNIDGIRIALRIENYEPTKKVGWDDQWCTCSWSFNNHYGLRYNMKNNPALMTCEVESIEKKLSSLLSGEMETKKTIACIEPYFEFIFYPGTDELNCYVEWIVNFWNHGALTLNYFAIVLLQDDIEALRDYLSDVIEKGTKIANKSIA